MESLYKDAACCNVVVLCYACGELCHCTILALCYCVWGPVAFMCGTAWRLLVLKSEVDCVRVGVMESFGCLESCGGCVMASGVSKVCQRTYWVR